jgi:O-antigen/teichoic acid export membrane protein
MLWLVGYGLLNAGLFRIATGSRDDSHEFTWRLFKVTVVTLGGAGLVLAVVAQPAINLLYGPAFEAAVIPLILLIPGIVAWGGARVLSNHISYNRGRPLVPTTIAIVGAVANLVGTLLTVPRWGLVGAAATTTITYAFVFLVTAIAFRRVS